LGGDQSTASGQPAAIPMVREWKLYPVDIPPSNGGPDVKFDIKLVQVRKNQ
jgi:hypothetical protein